MPRTILLVDDEKANISMIRRVLALDGYQVDCVHTPDEAIAFIAGHKPGIVFLDIDLNDKDRNGMHVLKAARQSSPDSRICMTSAYYDEYYQPSLDLGASEFLRKPFTLEELKAVIDKLDR